MPKSLENSVMRQKSAEQSGSVSELQSPDKDRNPVSPLRIRSMSTPQGMSKRFDSTLQQVSYFSDEIFSMHLHRTILKLDDSY